MRPYVLVDGVWVEAGEPAPEVPAPIDVVTWNVWFGEHMFRERATGLIAELARRRPDAIALQEVTADLLEHLLDEPWLRAAYAVTDVQLAQRYDVVWLVRRPVQRVSSVELPSQMGRRLLVVQLANGLCLATVHLESDRESGAARATQLAIIQRYLLSVGSDTVLVGDMNFAPDDLRETAELDPDLTDAWPLLHPEDPGYTVDSVRNEMRYWVKGRPSQKRIDRVFARGAWRPAAIELLGTAPIDDDGTFVSDHFGLAVRLVP